MIRVRFVADLARERPTAAAADGSATLTVAVCRASGSCNVPAGMVSLWWPIVGNASVWSGDGILRVDRRAICVCDSQREQTLLVAERSAAMGIIGSQRAWAALARLAGPLHAEGPVLFPATHAADLPLRRGLLDLLRDSRGGADRDCSARHLVRLAAAVRRLQDSFAALIDRCPGSTTGRRRLVFLRLQRVRNCIENADRHEHDVRQLAAMANYSVWRFIKLFKEVYGETPYAFVSRCRIDRAQRLLQATNLSIADVAEAVGFGSRATFVRAFARHGVGRSRARAAAIGCA